MIKAEIIEMNGSKVFLSAKKLITDPWDGVEKKYKVDQVVKGKILKVNPFGLFVSLDEEIHGLAHINSLNLATGQKIQEIYQDGEERDFVIITIEPKEHRLGLIIKKDEKETKEKKEKDETPEEPAKEAKKKEKSEKEVKKKEKKEDNKTEEEKPKAKEKKEKKKKSE